MSERVQDKAHDADEGGVQNSDAAERTGLLAMEFEEERQPILFHNKTIPAAIKDLKSQLQTEIEMEEITKRVSSDDRSGSVTEKKYLFEALKLLENEEILKDPGFRSWWTSILPIRILRALSVMYD